MESFLLAAILLTTFAALSAWSNTKNIIERLDRLETALKKDEHEVIDNE